MPKNGQPIATLIEQFDRDNDGLLSRQEAPPRLSKKFDRIDANHDGSLDRQELIGAAKLLKRLRKPANTGSPNPATTQGATPGE